MNLMHEKQFYENQFPRQSNQARMQMVSNDGTFYQTTTSDKNIQSCVPKETAHKKIEPMRV